jgi:hypothetical protein
VRMNKLAMYICAAFLLIFTTMAQPVQAQDFPSEADWKVSLYLWTVGIDGELGIGPIDADLDLSFSDLVGALNVGGGLAFQRDWGRNVFVADLQYYSLSPDDVDMPLGGTVGTDLDMPLLQFYYGRKFATAKGHAGWLVGARYMQMDTTLTWKPVLPDVKRVRSASPDFTDFLVGGFYESSISENWGMTLQGDIGFGGSEGSWNTQLLFQRNLQSGNAVVMGLRVTDIEFEDKLPNDAMFKYDAMMTGLMLGFTWD